MGWGCNRPGPIRTVPRNGRNRPSEHQPAIRGAGHNPYESVGSLATFDVMVAHRGGPEPDWVQLVGWGPTSLRLNSSGAGSIINPAESANSGMLAVGAAHWNDVNELSGFSSQGPTPDGRIKPEEVAANCGDTATSTGPFCGTSQASPHCGWNGSSSAPAVSQLQPHTGGVIPEGKRRAAHQQSRPQQRLGPWLSSFFRRSAQPAQPTPIVPGAPSVLSVTPGTGSLTVMWRAPAQAASTAITAYDLRHIRSEAPSKADGNWSVLSRVWAGAGSLNHSLTGMAGGTSYDVQVRRSTRSEKGRGRQLRRVRQWDQTVCGNSNVVPSASINLQLVADCETLLAIKDRIGGRRVR